MNKHLAASMKGLTAKVFRTYNASITFQQQLDAGTPKNASVQEKLNAYNNANRMVAILCNHQRAVPKTHDQSMSKLGDKVSMLCVTTKIGDLHPVPQVRGLKYERMKLRHALFSQETKYKKQAKYAEDESDIDDDWIVEHEEAMKAKEIEKAEKKFAKDNEKLVEDGKPPMKEKELKEKLDAIEEDFDQLKKERGTGRATLKRDRASDKLVEAIDKLEEKIKVNKLQIEDREAGKEVALGTRYGCFLDGEYVEDTDHRIVKSTISIHGTSLRSQLFGPNTYVLAIELLLRGANYTMFPLKKSFPKHSWSNVSL